MCGIAGLLQSRQRSGSRKAKICVACRCSDGFTHGTPDHGRATAGLGWDPDR